MKKLDTYLNNAKKLYSVIEKIAPQSNGITTLVEQIRQVKKMDNIVPDILQLLDYSLEQDFNTLVRQDSFLEHWNALSREDKETIIYISDKNYVEARKKLATIDFNFLFCDFIKDITLPTELDQWLSTTGKIGFYKLRKEHSQGIYQDFFENPKTQQMETNLDEGGDRSQYVKAYYNSKNPQCWYDIFANKQDNPWHIQYLYSFLKALEDNIRKENQIKLKNTP